MTMASDRDPLPAGTLLKSTVALMLAIGLGACGGGGGGGAAAPVNAPGDVSGGQGDGIGVDNPPLVTGPGTDAPATGDPNVNDDMPVAPDNGTPGGTVGEPVDGDATPPPPLSQDGGARFVLVDETPAPGAGGRELRSFNTRSVRVNRSGGLMFEAGIDDRETRGLWGGTLDAPRLLLESGMQVNGFPATLRLQSLQSNSARLAEDGAVAVIAGLGGSRSASAVLLSTDEGMTPVLRTDQGASIDGQDASFAGFRQVEHEAGHVAVIVDESTRLGTSLVLRDDSGISLVAPAGSASNSARTELAPLQPDGCRLMLSGSDSTQTFHDYAVRGDGSVVFEASVRVEAGASSNVAVCPDRFRASVSDRESSFENRPGSNFDAIVVYRDGEYTRLVSRGDPVPGMENTVFLNLDLVRTLDDGSILVNALVNDITVEREARRSIWIFREGAPPRLVLLSGERFDAAATSQRFTLSLGNAFRLDGLTRLDVSGDGSTAFVGSAEAANGDEFEWLLAGQAHAMQPHTSLAAPGDSALQPVLVTGQPAPPEFPDSAFWSNIGQARLLPGGGGLFGASIVDSAPGADNPLASGLWRYDADGTIRQVFDRQITVNIDEIPRTIGVPSSGWRLVGGEGIVYSEGQGPTRNRLVYLPLSLDVGDAP